MDFLTNRYVNRYMCSEACPCVAVDASKWGSRAGELASRNFSGSYSTFNSCYKNITSNAVVPYLSKDLLTLASYMESSLSCLGLCDAPLFWFYKDVTS